MTYLLSTLPPRGNILQLLFAEDELGAVTNLTHPLSVQEYSLAVGWEGGLGSRDLFAFRSPFTREYSSA